MNIQDITSIRKLAENLQTSVELDLADYAENILIARKLSRIEKKMLLFAFFANNDILDPGQIESVFNVFKNHGLLKSKYVVEGKRIDASEMILEKGWAPLKNVFLEFLKFNAKNIRKEETGLKLLERLISRKFMISDEIYQQSFSTLFKINSKMFKNGWEKKTWDVLIGPPYQLIDSDAALTEAIFAGLPVTTRLPKTQQLLHKIPLPLLGVIEGEKEMPAWVFLMFWHYKDKTAPLFPFVKNKASVYQIDPNEKLLNENQSWGSFLLGWSIHRNHIHGLVDDLKLAQYDFKSVLSSGKRAIDVLAENTEELSSHNQEWVKDYLKCEHLKQHIKSRPVPVEKKKELKEQLNIRF